MILDVLLRVGLDAHRLRGQCYDGAFVMSGNVSGVAARINLLETRALYPLHNALSEPSSARHNETCADVAGHAGFNTRNGQLHKCFSEVHSLS